MWNVTYVVQVEYSALLLVRGIKDEVLQGEREIAPRILLSKPKQLLSCGNNHHRASHSTLSRSFSTVHWKNIVIETEERADPT